MADGEARTVTTAEFLDELVTVTRQRDASTHFYLNLEPGGRIWVQWEQPGVDHPRRYRVVDPAGPACPHCVIIDGVAHLAPVLPLDALRLGRSRAQYEAVLAAGRLPSMAFGRRAWDPSVSWAGDCHAAVGDPHTPADCAAHCRPSDTADVGDPLTMVDPLPLAVQQRYPDPETAVRDVAARLRVAWDWRDAADEVAGGRAETEATRAFLARCPLALPLSDAMVFALRPGESTNTSTLLDLLAAAGRKQGGASLDEYRYHRFACLVPEPTTGRFPTFRGAFDVSSGEPIRTLRLPTGSAPLSRRGRGVLLLFEARHTMNVHVVSGPTKPPGYWQSEAALHIFEFGLLRALGGGYEAAVAVFLAKLRRTGDLLDRPERVLNRRQRKALAEPFGRIDDFELHLWASVAYRNAVYLALGSPEAFAEHLRLQDQLRPRDGRPARP